MFYLKGNSSIILERIKKLEEKPPCEWKKHECVNEEYSEKYFWFKYCGNKYPELFIYIPRKCTQYDKVFFMLLPVNNEEIDLIENKSLDIANSIFSSIIDDKIVLEGD